MAVLETNQLEIETGDGITFSLQLAGPVSRFLALMVDWSIVTTVVILLSQAIAYFPFIADDWKEASMAIAYFLLQIGYGVLFEWRSGGQTIGKKVVGLRVADVSGLRLSCSQIMIRNLLRTVDSLPVFYLLGGMVMILNRRMQRLGDIAAGTIVVRVATEPLPYLPPGGGTRVNSLKPYRALAARLRQKANPEAARYLLDALRRRDALEPAARLAIFAEMAAEYRSLVEFPEEATLPLTDEQYLWNVAEILFQRPGSK